MTAYQKILTVLVIVLVIFNVVLVGFIWLNRPNYPDRSHRGRPERPEIRGRDLQDKLDLTQEQAAAFRNALKTHHQKMRDRQRQVEEFKRAANAAILDADSAALLKANERLFEAQKNLELEAQNFTWYLSGMTNEDQRQKLLNIFERTLDRRR